MERRPGSRRIAKAAGVAVAALGLWASSAKAADYSITGFKLIAVDETVAPGRAKAVFTARDPAITKGAGMDPAQIEAVLNIAYDSASGRFDMPAGNGWLVNQDLIAKYVNKEAPTVAYEWQRHTNWFDMALTIALILSAVWGWLRGLARVTLTLVAWLVPSVFAVHGYPEIAQRLTPLIESPWSRQAAGFALTFLAVLVITLVCSALVRLGFAAASLSLMDRLLGGLFGLTGAVLLASLLLMMAGRFLPSARAQLEARSALAPLVFRSADALAALLDIPEPGRPPRRPSLV